MRDLGSIQAPQNAFLLNLGLETLHLRMARHCENAQKVAEFLESCPQVAWVNYPGLKNDKYHALAQKYMPHGTCGVIAFGLKGSREDAIRFMDRLKLAAIVTHGGRCPHLCAAPGQPHSSPTQRRTAYRSRRSPRPDTPLGRYRKCR